MQISPIGQNAYTISGDIKTISDYQDIKSAIEGSIQAGATQIDLTIESSQTVTSSVVGYFMKIVNLNGVKINMLVKNQKLYKMLQDLVLLEVFNVKKGF